MEIAQPSQALFKKRQAVINGYRARSQHSSIFRTKVPSRERTPSCDRCDEDTPIAAVVVKPESGEASLYCNNCYERTSIVRRAHPEWHYFTVSGGLDIDELAQTLADQGLLAARP